MGITKMRFIGTFISDMCYLFSVAMPMILFMLLAIGIQK